MDAHASTTDAPSDARARCTCAVLRRGSADVRVRRRSRRAAATRAQTATRGAARRGAARREGGRAGGDAGLRARARAGGRAGVCDDVGVDVRALEGCGPGVRARARPPLCGRHARAEAHGYVRAVEVCARRCEQAGGLAVYHASRHAACLGRPLAGLVRRRRRARARARRAPQRPYRRGAKLPAIVGRLPGAPHFSSRFRVTRVAPFALPACVARAR